MLWREVITAKYDMKDTWMAEVVNTHFWRAIRNLVAYVVFQTSIKVEVVQKTSCPLGGEMEWSDTYEAVASGTIPVISTTCNNGHNVDWSRLAFCS